MLSAHADSKRPSAQKKAKLCFFFAARRQASEVHNWCRELSGSDRENGYSNSGESAGLATDIGGPSGSKLLWTREFETHRENLTVIMKVAIQGEPGSFSDEAARKFLPGSTVVPCATSSEVFDRVAGNSVAAALIPIENSLAGPVSLHLDLLLARQVFVQREFRLRIRHNLIAAPGTRLADIRRVLSHPVALEQCREFLRRHPKMRAEPFYDTAGSVKHVLEQNLRDTAGIASLRSASVYGGRLLARNIEDDQRNFTRFFLLRPHCRLLPGANKTSVAFALRNQPGALFKALSVFALRDISLSKIESRPLLTSGLARRGVGGMPWEYAFFVDFLRGDDEQARRALTHLLEIAEFVRVLGIYPAAE